MCYIAGRRRQSSSPLIPYLGIVALSSVPLQKGNHCTAVACCFFLHTPISVLLSVERTIRQLSFLFCSRDSSRIPDHVSSDYLWKMNKSSTRVVFSYLELLTESCASGTCIRVIKRHFEDKEGVLR